MNSITKFAVKYPVSVLMLTLAVCLLGTISYNKLGTDLFPDLKKSRSLRGSEKRSETTRRG